MVRENKGFSERKSAKMAVDIRVYADPELKKVAGQRADKEGIPLSELVVKALARYVDRPDLAAVPRKRPGRPRKVPA